MAHCNILTDRHAYYNRVNEVAVLFEQRVRSTSAAFPHHKSPAMMMNLKRHPLMYCTFLFVYLHEELKNRVRIKQLSQTSMQL